MTTTPTQRQRLAICPPYCEGHDATYQSWERHTALGQDVRSHSSRAQTIASDWNGPSTVPEDAWEHTIGVEVGCEETWDGVLSSPAVTIWVDSTANLTPATARAFAAMILEAADRAEGDQA